MGVTLVLLVLVHVATRAWGLQWDFKVYLHAARAAFQGLDPYDPTSLAAIAGRPVPFPFLYAPIALLPLMPLAVLPTSAALLLWIGLKVAALGFIVHRWRRDFVPEAPWTAVALVAVFGCDAAALADLRSGNLGIFEAALLAAAFSAWLSGRARTFAALVVAASLFKLVPILYLGLLLVPLRERPARPRVALGAFLAFTGLVVLPVVAGWPSRGGAGFLRNVPAGFPIGEANPTFYALIETMARELPAFAGMQGRGVAIAWAAIAFVVVALLGRALLRHARSLDRRRLPAAFALVEALLSPRLMQYGFVRAGLPLLFWAPTGPRARAAASASSGSMGILAWAVLVSLPGILRWASHPLTSGLWMAYVPLVFLAVAFVVALRARESPTV